MIARVLMLLSAGVIFLLGALHLVYTFWGTRLTPVDPALRLRMSQVSPVITKEISIWQAWMGFNASHSMGLMLFGLIYGYLAVCQSQILFRSPFFLTVGLAMLGGLLALGKLYWFSMPFIGIGLSLAFYVASVVVSRGFE